MFQHWPGATSTGASGRRSRWRWRRGTGRKKVHKEWTCRKLVKLILIYLYALILMLLLVWFCRFLQVNVVKIPRTVPHWEDVVKRRFGSLVFVFGNIRISRQLLKALREAKAVEAGSLIPRWRCCFKLFPTVQHSSVCSEWLVFEYRDTVDQEGLAAEDEFQSAYMKWWGCFFRWKAGTTSWFLIWVNLITSNIKKTVARCFDVYTRICILTQETSVIRSLRCRLVSYKSAHMWQRSPMEPASNGRKWHPLSKSKNVDLHKINARIKMRWRARQW